MLDLGGIHNRAGGTIDFSTGKVTTFFGTIPDYENGHASGISSYTSPDLMSLKEGNHTITVLYLERGSSFSNCSIYFNLVPPKKTFEIAKTLAGLTEEDRAKYKNQSFTYQIYVKDKDGNVSLYNTPANPKDREKALYTKQDGTTERIEITNGAVTLKDGESVKLRWLDRRDTFYVMEMNLNGKQFGDPTAVETWTDSSGTVQSKVAVLTSSAAETEDLKNWSTDTTNMFVLSDDEKVTFTNTLKETSLEIDMIWDDSEPSHGAVVFTVSAYAEDGGKQTPVEVEALRENGAAKTFTLDSSNSWHTSIEHLPVYMPATGDGKAGSITYSVEETKVPGYTTTYKKEAAGNGWKWTITNTAKAHGKITVEKQWKDADGSDLPGHPDSIAYTVYQFSHIHEWGYWEGETWKSGEWKTDKEATEEEEGHAYQVCKYNSTHRNERILARVVETSPAADSADWETTYSGQENGLANNGKVTIVNKVKPKKGSLLIIKKVTYNNGAVPPGKESLVNQTFTFAVTKDGKALPQSPFNLTVKNGSFASLLIEDLDPGDYTITETGSGGLTLTTVSGGKTTDLAAGTVTVTVTAGNQTEEQLAGDAKAEFTNNLSGDTGFSFSKVWAKESAGLNPVPADGLKTWESGNTIHVTIKRIAQDAQAADTSFSLSYEIGSGNGPFMPVNTDLSDVDKTKYQLTKAVSTDQKRTTFTMDMVLEKLNADGKPYTYYVEETSASGNTLYNTYYGKLSDGGVSRTQGATYAKDGEVIINQEYCGYELPSTGGSGTGRLYLFGLMLIACAGAGLVMKRRRKAV